MKILRDLYYIFSPSGGEKNLSMYVRKYLDKLEIKYNIENNQLYRIIPDTPMVCAHMDQVSNNPILKLYLHESIIFGDGNLGADDKNGIWICLNLLKEFPETSFIFSTGEESGCDIDDILTIEEKALSKIKYCLVFDRRNGTDIIGTMNDYCNKDLQNDIKKIGKSFGYSPNMGTFSDCDLLSLFKIPCVNISCGYYNSHTKDEFTDLDELINSLKFGKSILKTLKKHYSKPNNKREIFTYKGFFAGEYDYYKYNNYKKKDSTYLCKYCYSSFYEEDIIQDGFCPNCGTPTLEHINDNVSDYIILAYFCPSCEVYLSKSIVEEYGGCPHCSTIPLEVEDLDSDSSSVEDIEYFCTKCNIYYEEWESINGRCIECGTSMLECKKENSGEIFYNL